MVANIYDIYAKRVLANWFVVDFMVFDNQITFVFFTSGKMCWKQFMLLVRYQTSLII